MQEMENFENLISSGELDGDKRKVTFTNTLEWQLFSHAILSVNWASMKLHMNLKFEALFEQ